MTSASVVWCGPGGVPLHADTRSTLHDGERRWPVVAGIPWLREGRDDVRERAVAALDAGDAEGAAVLLLADADDWWYAPPPPDAQLRAALAATIAQSRPERANFLLSLFYAGPGLGILSSGLIAPFVLQYFGPGS